MDPSEPIPRLSPAQRDAFDRLLEDAIREVPPRVQQMIEQVPVVVLDEPTPEMVEQLKRDGTLGPEDDGLDLCGLHTGVALTERSVEDPLGWGLGTDGGAPEQVHLFRRGICDLAGGWNQPHAEQEIYEEIRITLLHEIGHHFGLDEDDLEALGYG